MRGRLSPLQATIVVVIVVIVGANLLLAGARKLTNEPSGPPSSSYATSPGGVAAYSELLARNGHQVARVRDDLRDAELDPGSTVVVLDGNRLSDDDTAALAAFVEDGGQLILGGSHPEMLDRVLETPPTRGAAEQDTARPIAPLPGGAGVREIELAGPGVWEDAGETLPVLAGSEAAVVTFVRSGEGSMLLLADSSPLQNRLLDHADNAAFGLAAAGESGRRVAFVETVHGYGRATGLAALPGRWAAALYGTLLAALLFMWARGRRLGPPELDTPMHAPPRRGYVESLGALLARTRPRGAAVEPLQAAARDRVARRSGLPPGADLDRMRAAGARLGLSDEELNAIFEPARNRAEILAAGAALARLERYESTV